MNQSFEPERISQPRPFIRLVSKLALVAKIAIFGIFVTKFFDHVATQAFKILRRIFRKMANFFTQRKFRKKSIISRLIPRILQLALLFLPWQLTALYNGNPSLPMMPDDGMFIPKEDWLGIKLGYELDRVFDRQLYVVSARPEYSHRQLQKYQSLSNFASITMNFNDRFEVFGLLGTMSNEFSQNLFKDTRISYKAPAHFAWGAGARAILAYWGDLQLSINASSVQSDSPLSTLKINEKSYPKKQAECSLRQWQVGMGLSYRFSWFIPYLGVDYSDFRAKIEHLNGIKFIFPEKHITFKETYSMGLCFGFGINPARAFNLNVEARLINETAVSISADFKF